MVFVFVYSLMHIALILKSDYDTDSQFECSQATSNPNALNK